MSMKIAIACDHGAYALKEKVKSWLQEAGYQVRDFGCYGTESVDYPDFALPAAEAVAKGEADKGVFLCTTGIGVSICANKVKGVRCALCADTMTARMTRGAQRHQRPRHGRRGGGGEPGQGDIVHLARHALLRGRPASAPHR